MTADVPIEAQEAAIRAMSEAVRNPEALGPRLFGALQRIHGQHLRDEDWNGDPSKTAHAEGRKGLFKTGRLHKSLTGPSPDAVREVQGSTFTFGTNLFYARFLTSGAVIVPKWARALRFKVAGEWVSKDIVVLPAREFIGLLTSEDVDHVNDTVQDWLLSVGKEAAAAAGGDLDVKYAREVRGGGE